MTHLQITLLNTEHLPRIDFLMKIIWPVLQMAYACSLCRDTFTSLQKIIERHHVDYR